MMSDAATTTEQILAHDTAGRNQIAGTDADEADDEGETSTKRRIEIIVEKHRVLTIGTRRIAAFGWCGPCGLRGRMVTAEDASRIAQVTPRTISRWVETGELHFTESQDGLLLISLKSLG